MVRRVPEDMKGPPSLKADYADRHLYGGASFLVGIAGLVVGLASVAFGNGIAGAIIAVVGAGLMGAGFWMARRAE